jgi:ring-1,2-phenylacetyl-CoA epoxidase subunit PaaE
VAVYHVLSREKQELPLFNGRLDAAKIVSILKAAGPIDAIDQVFLCGPGGLIEESRVTLIALGMAPERLHVEYFTADGRPSPARAPSRAEISETEAAIAIAHVTLHGSAHEVPVFAGDTIVDAGLRAGLEMPYSCRGGMCCTCRGKLVAGEVSMDQNYSLEPWEAAAGFVLTCQSRPQTPEVTIDYDHI